MTYRAFSLEAEIGLAGQHARSQKEAQRIAPVGLGTTICDVMACGLVRSAITDEQYTMALGFQAYHYVHWHEGGVPRIRLSHGLATQLALTDPCGIDVEEIRLPFPVFGIELPFPNGPLVMESGYNSAEAQDAMMLFVSSYNETSMPLVIDESGSPTNAELLRRLYAAKNAHVFDQRSVHVMVSARDQTRFQGRIKLEEAIEIGDDSLVPLAEHSRRAMVMAYRIVVNLALYLKMIDRNSAMGSGRTVNHDHGLQSLLYEIGKEVKLERNLRDAARSFCRTGEASAKWKLEKRFIVRGHWKQQRFGAGGADRKLIFVEPYWKGPADAPVLARTHVSR